MLDDYLRRHDGVITLAQARCAGLSQSAVTRRVRSQRWVRCAQGVFFVNDRPFTDAARIRAAVWQYGPASAASGLAAAWWHGLTRFAPATVEVTVPRNSHGRSKPGSRLRRRELAAVDVSLVRGLRVTALELTVVEAAARRGGGVRVMDTALQQQVTLSELWRTHARNKGRYGSPRARMLLQAASDGSRSKLERRFAELLRKAGIAGWKTNYALAGYRVDFAFPRAKVAVELDGWAFHNDQEDFQYDRVRQNAIAVLGWQVLRFTWLDVTEYPDRVVGVLRAAISAR